MKRQDIEELEIYKLSMDIAEELWNVVSNWDNFAKNAIGYQLIRATDSISANISEGYGRFSYKENRQFCYIARGSLYETKTFLTKAYNRNLIEIQQHDLIIEKLNSLLKMLNAYIKYINSKISNSE